MRIAIDLETNLAHTKIWLGKTLNIDSGEVRTWYEASPLKDYLKECTLLVAHNGIGFDFRMLTKLWSMKTTTPIFDTLVVSRLLDPSREGGHSLKSWGERLGSKKTEYAKIWTWLMDRREAYDNECFDRPHMPLLDYYCEQDVRVLAVLFRHLEGELQRLQWSSESVALEHEVADIIATQVENGFRLDLPYATLLSVELQTELSESYERMQAKWPPVTVERWSDKVPGKRLKDGISCFNPASRQQVAEKLIELGWKPTKFTPTGAPQVDEGTLVGIDLPEAAVITDYFKYQKVAAMVRKWLLLAGSDGRVHGSVISNGAVTGRMTHSDPNVAQVPAIKKNKQGEILKGLEGAYGYECRSCWIADEGKVMVGCDASGLELRMLAHYMNDQAYIKTVVEGSSKLGTDVHTTNMKAAGLSSRDDAKTFIYAYLYGAGDAKIGSIIGGTSREGKKLKERFLKQTPALAVLKKQLEKSAQRGYCMGLDGRRIWIASEHSALNYLLQGAGAVVMKQALVFFCRECVKNNWPVRLVANVHDELEWETTKEYADITGQACVKAIEEAGEHFKLRCPVTGEYKYGRSWAETH